LLAQYFALRVYSTAVATTPTILKEADFADFVRYELFDPTRRHPVAVLSPEGSDHYVISPDSFGRELIGIAKTYVAASAASTYALTDALGRKELSCFHGAMRVYMPGLRHDSDPRRHPLLLPRSLSVNSERMRLAQVLALATVGRFKEETLLAELRDERAVAVEERRSRLLNALENTKRAASDGDDFRQLAEDYARHNEQLRREMEALSEELSEAKQKIFALQCALKNRNVEPDETTTNSIVFAPGSTFDAVEQAEAQFADDLLILPSALATAEESPFRRPELVANALAALSGLAAELRGGSLGQSMKTWFSERGIDYRSGIAKTTSKKLRQQYVFVDGSAEYTCEEHLNLGGASYDPADCLRIYCNTKDRPRGRIVVGHVGRHLDVSTTS